MSTPFWNPRSRNFGIVWHHFKGFGNPPSQNQYLSDREAVKPPIFGEDWPENAEHGLRLIYFVQTLSARLCTKIAQVRAQKIPLAATSSRACSRRKMIPRKSPIPCHRFRWNLDHPQTRHTKIYNIQLFNYPIYLPNSAGPKIRATVQPHFLNSTLCIE